MKVGREPRALWRRTLRGTLVLAPGSVDLKLLAPPGDVVWEALADPITPAELARSLAELFDVEIEQIERDLDVMLADLRAAELLIADRDE